MRLSELVSNMGLWVFPALGLVMFLTAFAVVCLRVARTPRDETAANGLLPLEDGTVDDSDPNDQTTGAHR